MNSHNNQNKDSYNESMFTRQSSENNKNLTDIDNVDNSQKPSFTRLLKNLLIWFQSIINIQDDADLEGAANSIKSGITFKGYNLWILIFSIFIASIGLNVNSIPVVIGAMLISPLMGPIVGMGFAIGTNDLATFFKSAKNLGIAVAAALLTSTLYFYLSPLKDAQTELLARTEPTLMDVLIAVFGGLSGIVAGSRKEKTNVIPGVAIATALMPPLCTAGYGIAHMEMKFIVGAFYLFMINSVCIALSTLVIVRYLKFPVTQFLDQKKEKRVRNIIYILLVFILLPSGYTFYKIYTKSVFNRNAANFITSEFNYEGLDVIKQKITYTDSLSTIRIVLSGKKTLGDDEIEHLTNQLSIYKLNKNKVKLEIIQGANLRDLESKMNSNEQMKRAYDVALDQLDSKEDQITFLRTEIDKLQSRKDTLPYQEIENITSNIFKNEIQDYSCGILYQNDFKKKQRITYFDINWNKKLKEEDLKNNKMKLYNYLKTKLDKDSIVFNNY